MASREVAQVRVEHIVSTADALSALGAGVPNEQVSRNAADRRSAPCVLVGSVVENATGQDESLLPKDVMMYGIGSSLDARIEPGSTTAVPHHELYPKPTGIDTWRAAVHGAALLQAAALLKAKLGLKVTAEAEKAGFDVDRSYEKRILVVGGEQPLAAAVVQLLKATYPSVKTYVTAIMDRQEDLFQRVVQLGRLGAFYSIDGDTPDLIEHLSPLQDPEGVDVLLNLAIPDPPHIAELKSLLKGQTFVDCSKVDMEPLMAQAEGLFGKQMLDMIHGLVVKAAEIFEIEEEPPSCGFDPDRNNQ